MDRGDEEVVSNGAAVQALLLATVLAAPLAAQVDPHKSPHRVAGSPIGDTLRDPEFRQQVRSTLAPGWEAHDARNFLVVSNSPDRAVVAGLAQDLEILRKCFLERFPPVGPMRRVALVRVFKSHEEYVAYGKREGDIGHFSPSDDELVLIDPSAPIEDRNRWFEGVDAAAALRREALHQYLHEAHGWLAPAPWFCEGFGDVFAGAVLDRSKETVIRIDRNQARLPWIKSCVRNRRWPDLCAFLKIGEPEFHGPSACQNYAFAWAFCRFLEEERQAPKGDKEWAAIPDRYLADLRDVTAELQRKQPGDATRGWILAMQVDIQQRAFERTFAKTDLRALEEAWIAATKKW